MQNSLDFTRPYFTLPKGKYQKPALIDLYRGHLMLV
jgi:hypothetical protein